MSTTSCPTDLPNSGAFIPTTAQRHKATTYLHQHSLGARSAAPAPLLKRDFFRRNEQTFSRMLLASSMRRMLLVLPFAACAAYAQDLAYSPMLSLKFRVAPEWLYQPDSSSMRGEKLITDLDDQRRALWLIPSCLRYPGTQAIAGEVMEWSGKGYVSPQEISDALSRRFPKLRWSEKEDRSDGQGFAFDKFFIIPWANSSEVTGHLYWNYGRKTDVEANTLLYFCQAPASGPTTSSKKGLLGSSQPLLKSELCQTLKCGAVQRVINDGPYFAEFFDTYAFNGGRIEVSVAKKGTILNMSLFLKNPSDKITKRFFEAALGYQVTSHQLTLCRQQEITLNASFGIKARIECSRNSYGVYDSDYDLGKD